MWQKLTFCNSVALLWRAFVYFGPRVDSSPPAVSTIRPTFWQTIASNPKLKKSKKLTFDFRSQERFTAAFENYNLGVFAFFSFTFLMTSWDWRLGFTIRIFRYGTMSHKKLCMCGFGQNLWAPYSLREREVRQGLQRWGLERLERWTPRRPLSGHGWSWWWWRWRQRCWWKGNFERMTMTCCAVASQCDWILFWHPWKILPLIIGPKTIIGVTFNVAFDQWS